MQTPFRLIAGALLCVAASGAFGLGFGRTTLTSSLGQTLSFALTVRLQPGEDIQPECLHADVLSGENRLPSAAVRTALRGQTGDVDERAMVVTTTTVIDEPIVTINVTVGCPPSLTRSFVAFVDPPVLNLARAAPPAANTTAAADTEPPTPRQINPRQPQPRLARPPAAAVSRPAAASEARAAAAPPAVTRPRPRAPAPATPASAPAPTARSSDAVASRNTTAAASTGGPRLQLESSRLDARPIGSAAASAPATSRLPTIAALPTPAAGTTASATASTSASKSAIPPASAPAGTAARSAGAAVSPPPATAAASSVATAAVAAASSAKAGGQGTSSVASGTPTAEVVGAGPSPTVGEAERQRLKSVEDNLQRLRSDSLANQRTLLAIQAQLREAEASRYANPIVYILAILCLLLAIGIGWLIRLRSRDRSEMAWWATPEGEAVRAAATQIMATGHGGLSERIITAPSAFHGDTLPPRTVSPPITDMTMPAVTAPAALGAATTPMRGPVVAPEPLRREMSVDELMDLEQQVDFFVVLGQDDSAIELLLSHLRGSGATNPLPYLKLLDIYLGRGERDAYERIRERFNQQFNATAPAFGANPADGRDLEGYGSLLARLQFLWPDPSQALEVLETFIFTRGEANARFDLPAYRELLFLYAIARDLAAREATGNVDVLLPLGDDFVDSGSPMLNTMSVVANPAARKPLQVDFDVSQPAAFEPSERDSGYGNHEFGSGFGALSDDPPAKPRKPPGS